MKLVHCADLHLDSPLRGLSAYEGVPADDIRLAARRALENLVELCLGEQVEVVLIAGDVYDGNWLDFQTGHFFVRQMARLREAGIRVFMVLGNHDAESKLTRSLRLPDNLTVFRADRPETFVERSLELAVHGQSFRRPDVTEDLAADFPEPLAGLFNIGLLHTAVAGTAGHAPYAPCSVATLIGKGYDFWALGHVHQRTQLNERPLILYPGNLQGRNIRETGAKGCSLITVADGAITSVEHRSIDVMRWALLEVDATACVTPEQLYDRLRGVVAAAVTEAEERPLAARLLVAGASTIHSTLNRDRQAVAENLRAVCTDAGNGMVWVEKVKIATSPPVDRAAMRDRDDAIGELLRSIDHFPDDAAGLAEIEQSLSQLFSRLPKEMKDDLALYSEDGRLSGDWLRAAEDLLFARLADQVSP